MKNLGFAEYFINVSKALLLLTFAKFLYDQTGEVWAITLVFIGEIASSALLPILVGRKVDKSGIKSVLILAALAHPLLTWAGVAYSWQFSASNASILVLSIALSMVWPLMKMAVFVATPSLSTPEALEKDNSMLTFAMQAGQFTGMGLSGWMLYHFSYLAILSTASALFTLAFVFYTAAAIALPAHLDATNDKAQSGLFSLVKESKPHLFLLTLSQFDFASVAIFNILLASIVAALFAGNSYWLAGLDASYALGALIGGWAIAKGWRKQRVSLKDTIWVQACFALYLAMSLVNQLAYLLPLCILVMGLYQSFASIYWRTRLQQAFPPHLLGSLAGIRSLVSSAYIGIVASVVSYAHEQGFNLAVVTAAILTVSQAGLLLFRHLQDKKTSYDYQEEAWTKQ